MKTKSQQRRNSLLGGLAMVVCGGGVFAMAGLLAFFFSYDGYPVPGWIWAVIVAGMGLALAGGTKIIVALAS